MGVEEADGGEVNPASCVLSAREPETVGVEAPPEVETEGESVGRLGEPVTMASESVGRLVGPVTDSSAVSTACSTLARFQEFLGVFRFEKTYFREGSLARKPL